MKQNTLVKKLESGKIVVINNQTKDMNQNDKILLIKKNLGSDTDAWTITSCLKLLKEYDKLKKANRIKSLVESMEKPLKH